MPSKTREEDITVYEPPTSINPYTVLSVTKEATQDEIKTAYRKAALKHHPDKAADSEKATAHTKFQEIAFAYAILSDERRRRRYDTTGRTEESLDEDDDFDWTTFFREQFADVVTFEKIDKFTQEYKGSEEEREHVLQAYERAEGNMDQVYSQVMLSDVLEDDERFRGIIDQAIEEGEVEGYEKYTLETEKNKERRLDRARKRKAREATEAEKAVKEMEEEAAKKKGGGGKTEKNGGIGDLAALIQQRQKGRAEDFFDGLEAKYAGKGGKKGGGKRAMDEPPEEAFERNAKKGRSRGK